MIVRLYSYFVFLIIFFTAVQECRQTLQIYAQSLANTVMAYDMIKHLLEKVVIDNDKARLIRRMGKGQNAETNRQILAELDTRGVREFEVYVEGLRKQEFSLLADLLEQKHYSSKSNSGTSVIRTGCCQFFSLLGVGI